MQRPTSALGVGLLVLGFGAAAHAGPPASPSSPWSPPTLAVCGAAAVGPPAARLAPARAALEAGPQVSFEPTTQTAFETRRGPDGSVELVAHEGQLGVRKTVAPDGRVSMELKAGRQLTRIVASPDGIEVTHGRRTLTFDPRTATEGDYERVRILLARSRPVRLFRRLAARLEATDAEDAPTTGVLVADAFVGMLDGDIGAPGRIARRLARTQRARMRAAGFSSNCYLNYEREVVDAWADLDRCYDSVSVLLYRMCEARWFLWVEASWFSFLSCGWGF